MIDIMYDLTYRNSGNYGNMVYAGKYGNMVYVGKYGNMVYVGSCRISTINSRTSRVYQVPGTLKKGPGGSFQSYDVIRPSIITHIIPRDFLWAPSMGL